MSKLLSYELKSLIENPEVQKVLGPGALIQIFNISQADEAIADKIPERRILKAAWLLASCFPSCCVRIEDLAIVLFEDAKRVSGVIDRSFLDSNSGLVAETRLEVEEQLREASIDVKKIIRRSFINLNQTKEILTTFLDVLQADEWVELDWLERSEDDTFPSCIKF